MIKLNVNTSSPYEILIRDGILSIAGELIRPLTTAKRAVIISDSNVAPLYEGDVHTSLENQGFDVFTYIFKAGESSKKLTTVESMVEFMAEKELTRNDIVVALGGGVCGDMAGFAASIYLRGINFVQIPTSLLAQIDSSVGGKTGVDLPSGKNLCGAFHQPILVIIDPTVLNTLDERFFNDGMAEAIKYGCIKSKSLFDRIAKEDPKSFINEMIFQCVDIKRMVVERDEKEHGERALLNFGHTIGHAIEKHYNFETYTHGEAVAIGMYIMTKISEELGVTKVGTAEKVRQILIKNNLPCHVDASAESIISAMGADKKRTNDGLNFIMLHSIGESLIKNMNETEIEGAFALCQI